MSALVYAYGCDEPVSGWPEAQAESELQWALWDRLVRIDRENESAVFSAACADVPELKAYADKCVELSAALDDMRARGIKRDNAAWKETLSELRVIRAKQWPLLKAWRKEHKVAVKEFEHRRHEAVKLARQESGCFWANYNRVIQAYESGRQVCKQTGRKLKFRDELREDGYLSVQIQRTKSGLGAAPEELFDGTLSMLNISSFNSPGRKSRILEMRTDATGNTLRIPVYFHRPLPPACRVKSAQITWRRVGETLRYQLCLTISQQSQSVEPPQYKREGALSLHWEPQSDGSLLVARIGNDECQLPPAWMQRMDRVERLHARLDESLKAFCEQWASHDFPELIRANMDPDKHAYRALHEAIFLNRDRIPQPVLDWRRDHRRMLLERENLRDKLLRQRREIYRLWAHQKSREYTHIEIDSRDFSEIAEDCKNEKANEMRFRAAPFTLRQEFEHQASKAGPEKSGRWQRAKALKKAALENGVASS